ncbi:MAG: hypothetical protein IKO40_10860, partial [Kiritimatiellae bacterium]|nr:hypothetical protein [Kiritimatiellia bacterium]
MRPFATRSLVAVRGNERRAFTLAPHGVKVFAPLYREGEPRRFEAGTTAFTTADGEPDANYFLPALWLAGDFRVFGGAVFAEKDAPVGFGSFAELGY